MDWGVRIKRDPAHTVYVWFDALNGKTHCEDNKAARTSHKWC